MNKKLQEKIQEALTSVLPITIIVLILSIVLVPVPTGTMIMFIAGAFLLIIGMGFFSLGADMSMMPMGEGIGKQMGQSRLVWAVTFIAFLLGFIITIAEPDLVVLADQVPAIPDSILIMTVAVGVGAFLALAALRLRFGFSLSRILIIAYAGVFLLSIFVPDDFLAVAFDSGGVTTGPITVPFIMALGLGLAAAGHKNDAEDDSFGFVALCSIGPILAVMLLGIFFDPGETLYTPPAIPEVSTTRDVFQQYLLELPHYFLEVLSALVPIMAFFVIYQIVFRRFQKRQILKIAVGLAYTLIGLVLFLTGVNVGFIPVGNLIGSSLAGAPYRWILIPLGMVIGYFIVKAEPAVHVLNRQVEDVTSGAVSQKAMFRCLSIGVAVSLSISMIRVLTGVSILWFLIPGYAVALILTFFVPKIFTGIAFDSGGVTSGPMTSTFLLPFAIGAAEAAGGNIMTDAFGIVAMVAMTPLIVVQIMGLVYQKRSEQAAREDLSLASEGADDADEIIDYDSEEADEPAAAAKAEPYEDAEDEFLRSTDTVADAVCRKES